MWAILQPNGTVTAGNASGLNDGACALGLMSKTKADELGLQPLARWVRSAAAGVAPRVMGLGPVYAAQKVLQRAGLTIEQNDLAELHEVLAVQALAVLRQLNLSETITNVNGGAIALGYPLGCSGARILTTLIYEMPRRAAEGQTMRYEVLFTLPLNSTIHPFRNKVYSQHQLNTNLKGTYHKPASCPVFKSML